MNTSKNVFNNSLINITDSFRLEHDTVTFKDFLFVYKSKNKITNEKINQILRKEFPNQIEETIPDFLFERKVINKYTSFDYDIYSDRWNKYYTKPGSKVLIIKDLKKNKVYGYSFDSIEIDRKKMKLWMIFKEHVSSQKYIYIDKERCYIPQ